MYDLLTPAEKRLVKVAKERPELRNKIARFIKKSASDSVVVFLEAVLDDSERDRLSTWIRKQEDTPNKWSGGWDVISHHMTIMFLGHKGRASDIPKDYVDLIGETVSLKITGYVVDDNAVAVLIEPPSSVLKVTKSSSLPHITVATNGVKPFYSNKLIKKKRAEKGIVREDSRGRRINFSIVAKLGWFNGRTNQDTFELPSELS